MVVARAAAHAGLRWQAHAQDIGQMCLRDSPQTQVPCLRPQIKARNFRRENH